MENLYPTPSCHECANEAAGRCPGCKRSLCMEHFPRAAHKPCAADLVARSDEFACYRCGVAIVPEQWSTAIFAHYVDPHLCSGCGRFVCDDHTRRRDEQVRIVQDGLRGHRYHQTARWCDLCAPVRRVGGLVGAAWWVAGMATVLLAGWFVLHG